MVFQLNKCKDNFTIMIVIFIPNITEQTAIMFPFRKVLNRYFFPDIIYLEPGFEPESGHVGFVVEMVALGQVFSENFGFPCQSLFQLLHNHHHLSSGAGTIGQ
jgi:hypothetical protein